MEEKQEQEDDPLPEVKPVVLLLLDGFGLAPDNEGNALSLAKTPNINELIKKYPAASLRTLPSSINARYLSIGAGCDIEDENLVADVTISSLIAEKGLSQVKITETLRLAALTNFFNGGRDIKHNNETWQTISSANNNKKAFSNSATDLIFKEVFKELDKDITPNFITVSVSAIDLSASEGDLEKTKKTITEVDKRIKKLVEKILEKKGKLIITSASGNAEKMIDLGTDLLDKKITNNPLPLILVGEEFEGLSIGFHDSNSNDLSLLEKVGTLADLAPSILSFFNIEKSSSMTGKNLFSNL
jgi:2,3-bisphosphoglycerate-independent phosphoglycerate mutase